MPVPDPPRLAWASPLTPMFDAFARLRISNPETLFDSKQLWDKSPLFWDESITNNSGNATSTHSTVNASTSMYVEDGDTIVRQTKTHWNYQSGKSQLFIATAQLVDSQAVTDETAVVVRKNSVDTRYVQSEWNMDKMDGTGPSRAVMDHTKAHILFIDFEWLGVGKVRFGFFVDGVPIYVHEVNNFNQLTSVYMSTPNLPVRYELSADTGVTTARVGTFTATDGLYFEHVGASASATLQHICSTVISEGGLDQRGLDFSVSTGVTHVDANVSGTIYGILGVRLKGTHTDANVVLESASVLAKTANDIYEWVVALNPTVAGTPTWNAVSNTPVEYAIGATANTVTADSWALKLDGGYASTASPAKSDTPSTLLLGSTIGGTVDQVWLCARPFQANSDILGALRLRSIG